MDELKELAAADGATVAGGQPATLEELDAEIEQALSVLNEKQRTFAHHIVDGDTAHASDAARLAGYSDRRARQAAHDQRNNPRVSKAIQLMQWRRELRVGIDVGRKRQILMNVAEIHQAEMPAASVSAIRELNSMDGHCAALEIKHSGQVTLATVSYVLDTGREPLTIDAECELVEDEPIESLF